MVSSRWSPLGTPLFLFSSYIKARPNQLPIRVGVETTARIPTCPESKPRVPGELSIRESALIDVAGPGIHPSCRLVTWEDRTTRRTCS